MTTGVIIQARMSSKRFPGKSMALLFGKPVIQHVIERAKEIKDWSPVVGIQPAKPLVILAIPFGMEQKELWRMADEMEIELYAESENNVLQRYYFAAQNYELKTIVRITGDCPFFDPKIASEVLAMHKRRDFEYTSNSFPKRTFPKGYDVEVMSFIALEAAWIMSKKAYDKEHVTPWLQRTEGVNRGNMLQKKDESELNLCVDYPEDIERLEILMSAIRRTPIKRKLLQ